MFARSIEFENVAIFVRLLNVKLDLAVLGRGPHSSSHTCQTRTFQLKLRPSLPQDCAPIVRATSMPAQAAVADWMLWLLAVWQSPGAGLEEVRREFSFWRLHCLYRQQSLTLATVCPSTRVLEQEQRQQVKCSSWLKAHTDCKKLDDLATCEDVNCCQKAARDAEHSGQGPLARHPCGLDGDLHLPHRRLLHGCEDCSGRLTKQARCCHAGASHPEQSVLQEQHQALHAATLAGVQVPRGAADVACGPN